MKNDNRRLRIGLLGCGPISQAAHLPETANVVDSPAKARRLLDELRSSRLKIISVARLEQLPLADLGAVEAVQVPVLVLAHQRDPIHRITFAKRLAAAISGAEFVELTPKSTDRQRHAAEVQGCLGAFLAQFMAAGPSSPGAPGSLSSLSTAD
jgi:hypothetical protein